MLREVENAEVPGGKVLALGHLFLEVGLAGGGQQHEGEGTFLLSPNGCKTYSWEKVNRTTQGVACNLYLQAVST